MNKSIFNAIAKQVKGPTSRIEPSEWNYIINSLSLQGNENAKLINNLLNSGQLTLDELKKYVDEIVEDVQKHTHPISDVIGLQTELDSKAVIQLSNTEPFGKKNKNWYKVTGAVIDEEEEIIPFIESEPMPEPEGPEDIESEPMPEPTPPYIESPPLEEE